MRNDKLTNDTLDVIVAGGSYAGMSAALQLARARRRIAVVDSGRRRNRFAATSHGFLGQDGRAPGDIAADAKRQLLAYPNVRWIEAEAELAELPTGSDGAFSLTAASELLHAKRVVLATGVIDDLPPLEGLAERWGRTVFH